MEVSKRCFTLVELLVCIAILSLIGTLTVMKGMAFVQTYEFKQSAKRLALELDWTRQIASTAHANFEFIIKHTGSQLICTRSTDEPMYIKQANTNITLNGITRLALTDKQMNKITLRFTASGTVIAPPFFRIDSKQNTSLWVQIQPSQKAHVTLLTICPIKNS